MYPDGSQTLGYHRFLQRGRPPCIPCEQLYDCHAGYPPASCRRDVQAPPLSQRSPQRRPVLAGAGPWSQTCVWEVSPALWGCPAPPAGTHCSSVSQHCGCVADRYDGGPALHSGIPHPLPHLQVKGHRFRRRRTIRYLSMDEEEGCGCSSGSFQVANGNCGAGAVFFEGGVHRDKHQELERLEVGSKEGCEGSHERFFSTEVPQKHLNPRRKGTGNLPSGVTCSETSSSTNVCPRRLSEETRQRGRKPTVRDQIRQVVTDLEDVLGGLKQVHVEMKEVVEQIDRLTADIHLESPALPQGPSNHLHDSASAGDLRVALLTNHNPPSGQAPKPNDEDRVVLRTNGPSPVHMASVVKTNSFVPPSRSKDMSQERFSVNGHLPHLNPKRAPNHTDPPQTLEPKVIIENGPTNPQTQKPPPYPQNGRCGRGPHPQTRPAKPPTHAVRGRQSTSMV
ncbi:Protein Largen [Oryzias melastigma]|uniref:Protein Largen n=1 Tax=Oryzias melastigma TaxID=30732 RepID=A0A834FH02_ORYME|nr:Protein Largen [Oryzias melastigma]